jgi:hypothetical protein
MAQNCLDCLVIDAERVQVGSDTSTECVPAVPLRQAKPDRRATNRKKTLFQEHRINMRAYLELKEFIARQADQTQKRFKEYREGSIS